MNASELLDSLLALFGENIPEADFFRAWRGRAELRRFARPAVTGEVDGETVKPGSEEIRLRFRIFLPEETGADRAEKIFAAMCVLAGEKYPGFSAISRGSADRDKATGLLAVPCSLSFLSQAGGTEAQGTKAILGGVEYRISGFKTSVSRKSQDLVSIGETEPFAVLGEETKYTVELEGLDVSGLERLAGFTAELGEGPAAVYRGCRWKSLSDVARKAVFLSHDKA